jgi:hypothetical protein
MRTEYPYDASFIETGYNDPAVITPGTVDVTLPYFDYEVLEPGEYGEIVCNFGSTLALRRGDYYFKSIILAENVRFRLLSGGSGNGVRIFVMEDVDIERDFKMTFENENDDAGNMMLIASFANRVYLDAQITWRGTLIAPQATLEIDSGANDLKGAFIAREVIVPLNTVIKHVSYNYR